MEPFSTIIGVIVGFLLSAVWEFWKDSNKDKKTGILIRTLLIQEVDYNVRSLTEVRTAYTANFGRYGSARARKLCWAPGRENFQGGQLSQDAWTSQLSNIHLALDQHETIAGKNSCRDILSS